MAEELIQEEDDNLEGDQKGQALVLAEDAYVGNSELERQLSLLISRAGQLRESISGSGSDVDARILAGRRDVFASVEEALAEIDRFAGVLDVVVSEEDVEEVEEVDSLGPNAVLERIRGLCYEVDSKRSFHDLCIYLDEVWSDLSSAARILALEYIDIALDRPDVLDEYREPPQRLLNFWFQREELPSFFLIFRKIRFYRSTRSLIGIKENVDVFKVLSSPFVRNITDVYFDFPLTKRNVDKIAEVLRINSIKVLYLEVDRSLSVKSMKTLLSMPCCEDLEDLSLSSVWPRHLKLLEEEVELEKLRSLKIPNLEFVVRNIDRLGGLRRLDLSGAKMNDDDFRVFLEAAGSRLENLESLNISATSCTFASFVSLLEHDGLSTVKDFYLDRRSHPERDMLGRPVLSDNNAYFHQNSFEDVDRLEAALQGSKYRFRTLDFRFQSFSYECFEMLFWGGSDVVSGVKSFGSTINNTRVNVLVRSGMDLEELYLPTSNSGGCPELDVSFIRELLASDFCNNLKVLDLSGQKLAYVGAGAVADSKMVLRELHLDSCGLGSLGLGALFTNTEDTGLDMSEMEVLNLRANRIDYNGVFLLLTVKGASNLRDIDLRSNSIRGLKIGKDENYSPLENLESLGLGIVSLDVDFGSEEIRSLENLGLGDRLYLLKMVNNPVRDFATLFRSHPEFRGVELSYS